LAGKPVSEVKSNVRFLHFRVQNPPVSSPRHPSHPNAYQNPFFLIPFISSTQNPGTKSTYEPEFTPVPLARNRHDGWSPQRQRQFLVVLAATGTVGRAAQAVGMSKISAYKLRKRKGATLAQILTVPIMVALFGCVIALIWVRLAP
jgi:hypothetical protein